MKKKICLIMYGPYCDHVCIRGFRPKKNSVPYCGTDMVCYDVSDEYVVKESTPPTCLNYSNHLDTMRVWGTDAIFSSALTVRAASTFTNTTTRTERILQTTPKDSK